MTLQGRRGLPALSIPKSLGSWSMHRKVSEHRRQPRKFPHIPRFDSPILIFSFGMYITAKGDEKADAQERTVNSAEMTRKYWSDFTRLFIVFHSLKWGCFRLWEKFKYFLQLLP